MAATLPTPRVPVEVRTGVTPALFTPLPEQFLSSSLPGSFSDQARRTPDRIAIDDGIDRWTYRRVASMATAVGTGVVARAPDRAGTVAVRSDPTARGVVLMLGVMFSGRPLLCLDPQHPVDYLARQVKTLGVRLALDEPGSDPLPGVAFWTPDLSSEPGAGPALPQISPHDTAAIISTSGSTGDPKGVIKTHASFLNTARYYIASMGPDPCERHALITALGFMAAYPPIFGALLTGGSVHPFPTARRGVEPLAHWLRERRISVLDFSPTLFRRLASLPEAPESFAAARLLRLSGETVRPADVRLARAVLPPGAIIETFFGSAEAGLCCHRLIAPDQEPEAVTLHSGRPIDNQRIDLLDDNDVPVPHGSVGRVVVSGRTVSPGYANDAAATAEAFADDPREAGARVYRSADVARRLPGGEIEHAGRAESLVKVNGVRIDPGAVERAIAAVPGVRDAAVAARPDATGRERLVAWYVRAPGSAARAGLIRSSLRRTLPREAVPGAYVPMDALPQTPSGKVDRSALPDPPAEPQRPEYRDPRDPLEKQIAQLWSDVLGVERVGLDDGFEALGGTSLEAAALTTLLESTYEPGAIMPTVLATNDRLEDFVRALSRRAVPPGTLVALHPSGRKRPFYFMHAVHGLVGYFGALARCLDPDRPFYGLQSVGLAGEEPPSGSIESMAERYVREIERIDPHGPYLLGGVCMGGLVAWEMARRLTRRGRPVAHLVIIDTWAASGRLLMTSGEQRRWLARHLVRTVRWRTYLATMALLRRPLPPHRLPALRRFIHNANAAAVMRYRPGRCAVPTTFVLARDARVAVTPDPRLEFTRLADGPAQVLDSPGEHESVCHGDNVPTLAATLRRVLDAADGAAP